MKTIFVDFDGTICPNKTNGGYPDPDPQCVETLRALKASGHEIILYTVRSNKDETNKPGGHDEMIVYLMKHGIPFDGFDSAKCHFNTLIDDKGLGIPLDENKNVDWIRVGKLLHDKGYISQSLYHFSIYFQNNLIWQFVLNCENDGDANLKGQAYKLKYMEEEKGMIPNTDFKFEDDFVVKFCTLEKHLESLRFRGTQY